jgi:hypothetical protein
VIVIDGPVCVIVVLLQGEGRSSVCVIVVLLQGEGRSSECQVRVIESLLDVRDAILCGMRTSGPIATIGRWCVPRSRTCGLLIEQLH